jgi:hypothetical protein
MDNPTLFSAQLSSGNGTVFVDLKVAKNGKEFLSIASLTTDKDGVKKRSSIRIFGVKVNSFKAAIADVPEVLEREETPEEKTLREKRQAEFARDSAAAKEVEKKTTNSPSNVKKY